MTLHWNPERDGRKRLLTHLTRYCSPRYVRMLVQKRCNGAMKIPVEIRSLRCNRYVADARYG
jgi:hypothetical protein